MEEKSMKNMKKFMALSLAAVMTVSMTAAAFAEETVAGKDDLPGKKIGVQLGTTGDSLATKYEAAGDGTVVERYNKGNDAIMALKQGKIDCVIIDNQPAQKFVEKNDDLMILDEALSEEEYAICVSKDNTELTEAINGALAELKEDGTLDQHVRCIITDIEMPEMDGHRLTKLVKSDDATKDIPIIIFSSLVNDEMKKKGEALGADAQLSKPEIGNLVKIVDELVAERHLDR